MKRGKVSSNKKGQFYIMAAIIIIAVLIGIFVLSNYVKTRKEVKIYDLGKELGIETGYVYDHGVYRGENIDNLLNQWTDTYLNYTERQEAVEDWFFIYGSEKGLTAVTFTKIETGEVGIIIGGIFIGVDIIKKEKVTEKIPGHRGEIKVNFKGFNYDFELNEGENFFFIIKGEKTAAT